MMGKKDDDDDDWLYNIKALLMQNFTECNNDYDNDETIILASSMTLDDELHE